MSKENLEQFMNQIAESEELQAKIGEEIDAEALTKILPILPDFSTPFATLDLSYRSHYKSPLRIYYE